MRTAARAALARARCTLARASRSAYWIRITITVTQAVIVATATAAHELLCVVKLDVKYEPLVATGASRAYSQIRPAITGLPSPSGAGPGSRTMKMFPIRDMASRYAIYFTRALAHNYTSICLRIKHG